MSDAKRIIDDIHIKIAETQLAIAESLLGEQRHKTAKAEAEARYAELLTEYAAKQIREVGSFPKIGGTS